MDEEDRGKRVPESEIDRKFSGPDSDSLIKQPPQKISKKKTTPSKKGPQKSLIGQWTLGFRPPTLQSTGSCSYCLLLLDQN